MKKKKNNNWIVGLFILVLVGILVLLINFSKGPENDSKLNLTEKKWIENNKKEVINISVANNIPVFSSDGEGVFFDFASKFEEQTELSLNLISYDASSDTEENDLYFEVVKQDDYKTVKDSDMVFYKDYYVLISKDSEKIQKAAEDNSSAAPHFFTLQFLFYSIRTNVQGFMVN